MSQSKDYHRGFDDAVTGKPPTYTGTLAEWQGFQAGQRHRDVNAQPVAYTRISSLPWLERVLNVVRSALQFVGQHDGRRHRRRPHCRGCARSWRGTQAPRRSKASDVTSAWLCVSHRRLRRTLQGRRQPCPPNRVGQSARDDDRHPGE